MTYIHICTDDYTSISYSRLWSVISGYFIQGNTYQVGLKEMFSSFMYLYRELGSYVSVENFLALTFLGPDFFVHVHTLSGNAGGAVGSGFDSMHLNCPLVLQLPCFQNCFFLTKIQSVVCSELEKTKQEESHNMAGQNFEGKMI